MIVNLIVIRLSCRHMIVNFLLCLENLFKDEEHSIEHLWCIDIDECANSTHLCPGSDECINHIGYYECQESFILEKQCICQASMLLSSDFYYLPLIYIRFIKSSTSKKRRKCLSTVGYQRLNTTCVPEYGKPCICVDFDECSDNSHDCVQGK